MAATAMIHARVEPEVKERATEARAKTGLTVSGAVSLFLTRIAAEQAIPSRCAFLTRRPLRRLQKRMSLQGRGRRFAGAAKLIDALEAAGE
ncbi:MAG TPA: type II toxin-antitoxin system RelB/DinJ family antitoxin [Hyphomicrobiales bacterium]|nr:type II toxin-antitoxin system RelB/DinJ family antitoxin [Hyphomicrobiales bacterium]